MARVMYNATLIIKISHLCHFTMLKNWSFSKHYSFVWFVCSFWQLLIWCACSVWHVPKGQLAICFFFELVNLVEIIIDKCFHSSIQWQNGDPKDMEFRFISEFSSFLKPLLKHFIKYSMQASFAQVTKLPKWMQW